MKTLSDKAVKDLGCSNPIPNYYWEKDVKEFVQNLKNRMHDFELENNIRLFYLYEELDELAGDKLK